MEIEINGALMGEDWQARIREALAFVQRSVSPMKVVVKFALPPGCAWDLSPSEFSGHYLLARRGLEDGHVNAPAWAWHDVPRFTADQQEVRVVAAHLNFVACNLRVPASDQRRFATIVLAPHPLALGSF